MNDVLARQRHDAVAINALLLPVEGDQLLVPLSAIAEVVNDRVAARGAGDPEWLHGWIDWRQQHIPVLSFETLAGKGRAGFGTRAVIAVCYGVTAAAERGFYGLALTGFPRSLRVFREQTLVALDARDCRPGELLAVELASEQMLIPDLDYLETLSMAAPLRARC